MNGLSLSRKAVSPFGTDRAHLSSTARLRAGARDAWAELPFAPEAPGNAFAAHRERVLYPIAGAATLAFLPLAVFNYAQGRTLLGALLVLVVLMLGVDALAVRARRKAPIPFAMLLLPGAACVALSLTSQGIYGALWAYPMALFSYFALPRRLANVTAGAILAMTTALMYAQHGGELALRIALSLALCLVTVNIILGILHSLHGKVLAQSLVDPLTGAFNRRHMERCVEEVAERKRRTGAPATALVLDLDHFKEVNDLLGHDTGDRVLKALVSIVDERSRKLDLLFRMGGEEFLLLLPDTRLEEASVVAEHVRAAVERSRIAGGQPVTVSIGAAELGRGESPATWIRRADDALYRAKGAGRNRVAT